MVARAGVAVAVDEGARGEARAEGTAQVVARALAAVVVATAVAAVDVEEVSLAGSYLCMPRSARRHA